MRRFANYKEMLKCFLRMYLTMRKMTPLTTAKTMTGIGFLYQWSGLGLFVGLVENFSAGSESLRRFSDSSNMNFVVPALADSSSLQSRTYDMARSCSLFGAP